MKLISCLLILFSIEMHNARQKNTPSNVIRIPLTKTRPKMENPMSAHAKTIVQLDDTPYLYTGPLRIGTPPQFFDVVFDTGSPDFFVLSRNYDTCAENYWETQNSTLYDRSASSTYKQPKRVPKPQAIEYATAWVFGFRAFDVIQISGDQVNAQFLEITRTSEPRVGAVMGMGYDVREGNIVSKLCQITKGEQKFSIYLPKEKGSEYGELFLCGTNQSKYYEETIQYVNELNPGDWFFNVDKVEMNLPGKEPQIISEKSVGIADTGSNLILVPSFGYRILEKETKAYFKGTEKRIDCDNAHHLPVLNFTIGGRKKLSLTGDDYIAKLIYLRNTLCFFPFREDFQDRWVFGESFFRKYYTIYDMANHKVGFAESRG